MSRVDRWLSEQPRRRPAKIACLLAQDRFWRDETLRLIGTHTDWPDAAFLLDLDEDLAHATILVLSHLPVAHRRTFADAFYEGRHGDTVWRPSDRRARLSLGASIALQVVEIVGDPKICTERVLDLLRGAAQGDDLTLTPLPALEDVKKVIARIHLEASFEDPANPQGAAALAIAEVLDPASDVVDVKEVLARSAWAAVAAWELPRVLGFLLEVEGLFAEACAIGT